jgi:hypothetical protein
MNTSRFVRRSGPAASHDQPYHPQIDETPEDTWPDDDETDDAHV